MKTLWGRVYLFATLSGVLIRFWTARGGRDLWG